MYAPPQIFTIQHVTSARRPPKDTAAHISATASQRDKTRWQAADQLLPIGLSLLGLFESAYFIYAEFLRLTYDHDHTSSALLDNATLGRMIAVHLLLLAIKLSVSVPLAIYGIHLVRDKRRGHLHKAQIMRALSLLLGNIVVIGLVWGWVSNLTLQSW